MVCLLNQNSRPRDARIPRGCRARTSDGVGDGVRLMISREDTLVLSFGTPFCDGTKDGASPLCGGG